MNIVAQKRYSTVQVSQTQHIELNCDFLYINHSCEPSLEFHVSTDPKRGPAIDLVVAERTDATGMIRGVKEGEDLTFFYPSTEWEMAQPFECTCRTPSCKGIISGAKHMRLGDLQLLYLNPHIEEMLRTEGLKN
jgi:SET domain-containing protein